MCTQLIITAGVAHEKKTARQPKSWMLRSEVTFRVSDIKGMQVQASFQITISEAVEAKVLFPSSARAEAFVSGTAFSYAYSFLYDP